MALSTTLLEPVSYNDIDQKYISDKRQSITKTEPIELTTIEHDSAEKLA